MKHIINPPPLPVYAGHADGKGIQLKGEGVDPEGQKVFVWGLADALQKHQSKSLQLVFLNGCDTEALGRRVPKLFLKFKIKV